MNYLKVYSQLCDSRKSRGLDPKTFEQEYVELHHIVPRCLGGSNEKRNLVMLTNREHFLAHWLLTKIYPNNDSVQSSLVAQQMSRYGKRVLTNWQKEICKKILGRVTSKRIAAGELNPKLGKPMPVEACSRIGSTLEKHFAENGNPTVTDETKAFLSEINTGLDNPVACQEKYVFFNPKLGEIVVQTQYDFYTSNNFCQGAINAICFHKNTSYHNWYLAACPYQGYLQEDKRNHKRKFIHLETGQEFKGSSRDFYKKYKLNDGAVGQLISGKKKYLKGWVYGGLIEKSWKPLSLSHYVADKMEKALQKLSTK